MAAADLQLLSGEVVHLRQRLQMEALANQELEEVTCCSASMSS